MRYSNINTLKYWFIVILHLTFPISPFSFFVKEAFCGRKRFAAGNVSRQQTFRDWKSFVTGNVSWQETFSGGNVFRGNIQWGNISGKTFCKFSFKTILNLFISRFRKQLYILTFSDNMLNSFQIKLPKICQNRSGSVKLKFLNRIWFSKNVFNDNSI